MAQGMQKDGRCFPVGEDAGCHLQNLSRYSMDTLEIKNLFIDLQSACSKEVFETILENGKFTLERIVSTGQSTPEGEWCDQDRDEWVVLLSGGAGLFFEGEDEVRVIRPGDYILIPAHARHRVEWTDKHGPSIWLAVHYKP
jgi:cupin 2 domain-containing protein